MLEGDGRVGVPGGAGAAGSRARGRLVPRARFDLTGSFVRPGRAAAARITVVAATKFEAAALRRTAPNAHIIHAGIALRQLRTPRLSGAVVSCGLAGGVRPGLATGAVVIPDRVLRPDGRWRRCDPQLVDCFAAAARALGYEVERGALGTADAMVRGAERAVWVERGCIAVDMETGRLDAPRIAAVRVVLDTPERDVSALWAHPAAVLLRPDLWAEALWLWRVAPACARRAAAVLARGLASSEGAASPE